MESLKVWLFWIMTNMVDFKIFWTMRNMIDFSKFFYIVCGLWKITFIPNTIKCFPKNVFWKMIFLYIPNTRKRFPTILKISTKHRKMSEFSRKCYLENESFSKKRFTSKQTEPNFSFVKSYCSILTIWKAIGRVAEDALRWDVQEREK